jgi:uncharacterized SAM-binding protein YcdF (DUF218 family)
MRTSLVRGFMGGAALLVGLTCSLSALSGDMLVWASPLLVSARVWNGLAGLAWLFSAAHGMRPLPRAWTRLASLFMAIFALAAARDTFTYYSLVAEGGIESASYVPASLGLLALTLASLLELQKRREGGLGWNQWLLSLSAAPAGGLAACLIVLMTFGATDYRRPANCAIVLGAGVYRDGTASLALQDRVAQGVELYHQGHVQFLLMTGGVDPHHGQSEAQVMRRLAVQAGVPADRVRLDELGINTRASALNCTEIMQEQEWKSALLVSHDYHLLRAKTAFSRAGSLVYTVPAEETRPMSRAPYFVLRECVAWIYYALPTLA